MGHTGRMNPRWEVRDLGPAISAVNVRVAGFGALPDGRPIAYALSNGSSVVFSVVDLVTGKSLFCKEIQGATLASWIAPAPNGDLYLSVRHPTPAALYRFDATAMRLEHLEDRVAGARSLHSGVVDAAGRLWFGTHPQGKLVRYDPGTGDLHDYGQLTPEASWVFSVAIVAGRVWAGTGPVAHLYEIDPDTDECTEIHPPVHVMAGTEWFLRIDPRNEDVLVRLGPRGGFDTVVFHTRTREWSTTVLPDTHGGMPSPVSANGTTYILTGHRELVGYHTHSRRVSDLPSARLSPPSAVRNVVESYGLGMVRVPELGLPGQSVVGISLDGDLWFANIATGHTLVLPAQIPAHTAEPHTIGIGPDGHAYVGAYLGSGVIHRVDQHTNQRSPLRGPRGCDVITTHGDEVAITSTPGPQIHVADPQRAWEWGVNPRRVLAPADTGATPPDRFVACVSLGTELAVATVAPYGPAHGGVLVLDPRSRRQRWIQPVTGQAVVSLAHAAGVLYGATSSATVQGRVPADPSARLFAWDLATDCLRWALVVDPDAHYLAGLVVGPDGMVVGSTSCGGLFVVDPGRPAVTRLVDVVAPERQPTWGNGHRTVHHAATGTYLATIAGALVAYDPVTGGTATLSSNMLQVARTGNGRVLGIDETNLYEVIASGG